MIARYVAQCIHYNGIFETVIEYKSLPYLPHEHLKRYFEAVQVKDIMSEPPLETLGPQERVGELVELLANSKHNGFPVIESHTRKFLGLVRRVQIAALIECGVFSKDRDRKSEGDIAAAKYGIQVSGNGISTESTPLMHWAYLINDDRYDHIMSIPEEENPAMESYSMINLSCGRENEEDDEFADYHAHSLLTKEQLEMNKSIRMSLMPSIRGSHSFSSSLSELPQEFATVTRNDAGNVVIPWYNVEFESYWVDLASVANRGTYTVTEFCPVMKAYNLCKYYLLHWYPILSDFYVAVCKLTL